MELLCARILLSLHRGAASVEQMKPKGNSFLWPERRSLILWRLAMPLLTLAAGLFIAAFISIFWQAGLFGFFTCLLSFLGCLAVVPWGYVNFRRLKGESHDFINWYTGILVTNSIFLFIYLCFATAIYISLKND